MKILQLFPLIVLLVVALFLSNCGKLAEPEQNMAAFNTPSATKPVESTQPSEPATTTSTSGKPKTPVPDKPVTPYGIITVALNGLSSESLDLISLMAPWGACMFDPLITWDKNGNYTGSVAETWTFHIRDDIKFHNGDPLTAIDVKFSIDRLASKESINPWSGILRNNLRSTEVPDDYTFIYRTNTPELPLINAFAATPILPGDYFNSVGPDEFEKHPIGSGSWKFVEHVPATSVLLEANTEHWLQVPAYKYVREYLVPEEYTRVSALDSGEVDMALFVSADRTAAMMKEGWRTEIIGLPFIITITFPGTWMTDGPTSDIRVRQAMSYAINRQEMCDTLWKGLAEPGGRWYMHKGSWGWDPKWKPDPYDPELARRLLSEAGYPDAFSTPTIKYFISSKADDFALALQNYWTEVGIDVKFETVDSMVWFGLFFIRQMDPDSPAIGGIFPFGYTSVFDSTYQCANMYTSTGAHTGGNDPVADELYRKAVTSINETDRKRLWMEFQNYVKEMWINIGIATAEPYFLVGPNLGEFTTNTYIGLGEAFAGIKHP
jgi:peptide/nickel transport system substrate-binding protein